VKSERITRKQSSGRYFVFSIIWLLSFLTLIQFTTRNEFKIPYNEADRNNVVSTLPKNQLGAFSYQQYEPKENGRAVVSLNFKGLAVENNKLGIFTTGLHRAIKLRDLSLNLYQYNCYQIASTSTPTDKEEKNHDLQTIIEAVQKTIAGKDRWRVNIDLSNISEIIVNGFDYRVFRDGDLFLGIQSKRAIASYNHTGIVLRGHVKIETVQGNTLVCNLADWDIEKGLFKVDGVYALNSSGKRIAGRNICVDTQLRVCENNHSDKKEEQKCYTKQF
jgi:hypothetical protein